MTMIKNDTDKPMFVDPADLGEKRSDCGPAFPQHGWSKDPEVRKQMAESGLGMSLRDYFAGQAMNGIVVRSDVSAIAKALAAGDGVRELLGTAGMAYALADAMLKARAR